MLRDVHVGGACHWPIYMHWLSHCPSIVTESFGNFYQDFLITLSHLKDSNTSCRLLWYIKPPCVSLTPDLALYRHSHILVSLPCQTKDPKSSCRMSSAMILLLVGSMAVWLSAAGRPEVVAARLFEFRESFLEEGEFQGNIINSRFLKKEM